ncbi:hypothetical protein [Alistipes dispar]|uniref:hypothetical protein n=1 Tax=Alistipes dispar TaxID=2585119 RepID=UPI00248CAEB9|nr:hypothetical protein [Alistipes dispar]
MKLSVAPGDNGACSCGIQEESILAVSFTAFECIALEVYDYADFEGRRYWILERYLPQMNARREWTYSIRMSGAEGLAGQTLMVNPEDDDNPVLTLSAPAREHAALIVANMNRRTGTTEWKVGEVVVSEYIDIEYTGKYASDALSELSAAAKTEWWFDGMTLNISRCEFGEPIPLSYGNGLIGGISRTTADGVKFFTRLFPVGSSRNIDPDYYGHARLQLPGGVKYVEQDTRLGIIEHYEQAAFEDIFPRRVGQVGTVRHEEAMGDDGEPFTIWYFTDPDIPFDPNQYEIGGLVKRVTFQSGELRGREFEVNYDTEKKEFEIITQWPYDDDLQLPSEPLIPAPGDEYILWNIRMPESYYPAAELEYKEAVDRFMADNRKDVSVWQAPTDFTVIERRALDLQPGQRIRLESAEAFPDTGFRETRIVSISRSVVRPGSMTLKMSDVLSTGRISRIESNIASVERLTKQVSSEFPDIIRSWEETPASDTTLYSSRKSEREFLNKRRGGTVEADVIFDKDIMIGGSVVSKDFRQGDFSGSGFGAYRDRNGNAVVEADILKIRKEAIFNEAVINQVTFRVGATVFSNGGCEITRVEELETAFRCYYDNREGQRYSGLTAGDQVRCQRYDPTQHTIIKYYWRLVTAVGEDYVELSKSDADGSASPEAGDEIAQFGNRSDITRQSAIVINPLDGGSVEVYAHIDAYSLSEKNYVGMGVNPQTGEAYMYAYGDMFFGDRDLADSKSSWITYQKKEGEERRRLRIKADVTFGADSSGLGNLSEFKAQQQQIDDARKEAEEAKKEVAGIQIGGVNLLNDSETLQSWIKNNSYTNVAFEEYQGYKSAVITNSVGAHVGLFKTVSGLNVGDEYMMSVWVFAEQPTTIHCGLSLYEYSISENEVGKWIRISHVQKAPSASKAFLCTANLTDASHKIAFRMAQLEAGNKVTAWSPSIADQEKYTNDKVDGIQIGSVNLIDDTKSRTVTAPANSTHELISFYIGSVKRGEQFAFSIGSIEVLSGNPAGFQVRFTYGDSPQPIDVTLTRDNRTCIFTAKSDEDDYRIVMYAGIAGATNGNSVRYNEIMLVRGNKPALSWSPSIADQEDAVNAAQQTADQAAAGVDSLKNFTDEAFADGIVDRAEAAAIGKYTNSVNETRKAADAAYAEIYGNPLLGGTAKSNLQAAKSAFDTAAADLLAAIATAADDGIASPGEQADVDAKYTLFNNAYGTFGTRLEEANKYMLTAVNTASQGALQLSQELQGVVNNINETILPDLQAQIDGSIVSWGGEEVPTLSNYPANQWTSDTERKRHIGDYYDRKTTVDGQAAYERYKFAFENNAYQWVRIADSGGAAAIATAREALGLAGTKARIFFGATTPAVPYSVNDVWFRSSGSGATLETTVYISNADKGQQETASAADWQLVDDSQVRLRQMSSDGVISREEKASLRNRLAQIQKAYTSYQNDAATYGVSIADLAAAYSALVNFLTGTVAVNNDTDTTLSAEQRSTYNAAFAAYDAEVSRFSNLVADAISQGKVDDIQVGGVNLLNDSATLQSWIKNNSYTNVAFEEYQGYKSAVITNSVGAHVGLFKTVSGLNVGDEYMMSVWVFAEQPTTIHCGLSLYEYSISENEVGKWIRISHVQKAPSASKAFLCTANLTDASHKIAFRMAQLEAGNKVTAWSPSIADQEKYTDDKVDGIQIGGVNLLNDSRSITIGSWWTKYSVDSGATIVNEKFDGYDCLVVKNKAVGYVSGVFHNTSGIIEKDGYYAASVYIQVNKPCSVIFGVEQSDKYQYDLPAGETNRWIRVQAIQKSLRNDAAFIFYIRSSEEGTVAAFRMAKVETGNKVTAWTPSIADQEKYADETAGEAVNGVETQIDASKLDQNTYYPVTIKLNGIARSKITVRVNLSDTQPGKPVWTTYKENRFSCQAVWYNNGNSWGSNYDKRVVEEYQHRYADGRPIGSVGQMTNSSNEYIYVRGGGVYRFFTTNAGTPVLHTEAYTVNEQTVDLKTSVEPLVSLQEQANSTQQEAETTRQAIADMNDDTIFDVSEKQSIRTQWENISGYARTDVVLDSLSATNGSYYRVRDMAKAAGISTAGLLAAVNSLRVKLNDYALYTASNTPGFDRAGLAVLFTAYYAQEIDVLNAVSQKYTDGKVADIETSMKDYDYLKLVFPNNTVDNNGVFLSRLMAVKNGTSASAAVVAGLYGGGVDSLNNAGFKDATHGILMMFAGATSIQNVAAAKTRIYGDGTLYTSKLVAQAGTIAGFTIGTGYIGSENLIGSEYFYLSSSVIKNGKKDTYAMIGDIIYKNRKVAAALYNHYGSTGIGLVVDMGDNSHAAIYVPNGTFSGFRPMSRSYGNGTYTLHGNEEETVFFVNTSKGSTTFYLPSNPQPDQRYEIRKLHSGNSIIINAQNNGDIYVTGSNNPSSQISWTGRRCATIQYSKNLDAWVMWFSYEA